MPHTMADPVVVAMDRLEDARAELKVALDEQGEAIAEARERRAAGEPISAVVRQNGTGPGAVEQVTAFLSAFAKARAAWIWSMVEEEGHTLTHVARLMGNARQVVSRLYQVGRAEADKILGRVTGL